VLTLLSGKSHLVKPWEVTSTNTLTSIFDYPLYLIRLFIIHHPPGDVRSSYSKNPIRLVQRASLLPLMFTLSNSPTTVSQPLTHTGLGYRFSPAQLYLILSSIFFPMPNILALAVHVSITMVVNIVFFTMLSEVSLNNFKHIFNLL
jgi:hypothetical protein